MRRDELTLARLAGVLLRYRMLCLAIIGACTLAGLAYAMLARPVYQADMMIQLDDGAASSSTWSLLGDAASLLDLKSSPAAETQIIGSRLVVERAVERLRLHIDTRPRLAWTGQGWLARWRGEPAPSVEAARFDVPREREGQAFRLTMAQGGAWQLTGTGLETPLDGQVGVERTLATAGGEFRLNVAACACGPGASFEIVRQSWQKTVTDVRARLSVQEKARQSGVLMVTLTGLERGRLQALLHEIGEQYIRQNMERKSAEAAQSLVFLDRQLPGLKRQLELAQDRYASMNARHGVVDLSEEARLALKAAAEAETQRLWLTQKRQELVTRFTSAHPGLQAVDSQLDVVRRKQLDLDRVVRGLPDLQRQATQLELDVRVATELYTSLLASAQQLQLMKAGRVASARVVDVAQAAEDPVAPNRVAVVLLAVLGGVIAAAGAALARDWLACVVGEPEEIEQALGVSVLGVVPHSIRQQRLAAGNEREPGAPRLLSSVARTDPAVESLRSLRTALQLSNLSRERNVVLVTGCEPGAGKTFVSANLAAVLAAAGQRVLLIDGDMRRGVLHTIFDCQPAPGLADALAGQVGVDGVVRHDVMPGMDLICQGTPHPHVGELLAGADLVRFADKVRQHYDVVLIDAPPVLAAADATLLARHADLVLLVARADHSHMADLVATARSLRVSGVTVSGVILNGLVRRRGHYGYRYGYDYGDDRRASLTAAPVRWWRRWRAGRGSA